MVVDGPDLSRSVECDDTRVVSVDAAKAPRGGMRKGLRLNESARREPSVSTVARNRRVPSIRAAARRAWREV
jgi:hypothetical protein